MLNGRDALVFGWNRRSATVTVRKYLLDEKYSLDAPFFLAYFAETEVQKSSRDRCRHCHKQNSPVYYSHSSGIHLVFPHSHSYCIRCSHTLLNSSSRRIQNDTGIYQVQHSHQFYHTLDDILVYISFCHPCRLNDHRLLSGWGNVSTTQTR